MQSEITVRRAAAPDAETFLSLVDALADYEKLDRPTPDARERLTRDAFGPKPRIEAWLAEENGTAIGYAITFESYSSFLALPTLYLEDLFILPEYRKRKAGWTVFRTLAAEAVRRGCGRMEWAVLDWNQLAIDFYERLGAKRLKEWYVYRLTNEQLRELTGQTSSA